MLLQATRTVHFITKEEKNKLLFLKIYHYSKGGNETPDQRMGLYTTKHK